ncbi:hypothetical protein D8M06_07405 [Oceanobacillus halophilus]|uniref:Uncharacterized protein n=1 Tax=Oceanobacillus halophilus TaxID=930130 RepID=A0A495A6H7_9BACI|nr:hypothetical protein D8M06_07405 [Oceanobacillus halophilus]
MRKYIIGIIVIAFLFLLFESKFSRFSYWTYYIKRYLYIFLNDKIHLLQRKMSEAFNYKREQQE